MYAVVMNLGKRATMQNYASLQETQDQEEQGILFHVAEPTRSRWNHIEDLDSFFSRMYKYHAKHGFFCMLLQELFELNQFIFVVVLTTYLVHGINYAALFNTGGEHIKPTLHDVVLPVSKCVENFTTITWLILIIAVATLCLKCLIRCYQIISFWDIKQFYNTALKISDAELDNLTWHEVQSKIIKVQVEQQMCIHKRDLTELDIYHRILRQENYMNKFTVIGRVRLLDGRLAIQHSGFAILVAVVSFESPWHLREDYKKAGDRKELARQLSRQILWLAFINLIFAPLILVWQVLYIFFNYAELIKREPGKIGVRNWSLYGKLYIRHFNELDHELHARLSRAYRPATKYLASFTSPIMTVIAQHLAFICGALFSVLIALTIYDEDVIAVESRHYSGRVDDMVPRVPSARRCDAYALPAFELEGRAHTSKIKEEFQQLFQYRIVGLIEDLLSPILTPYFLIRWAYPRSLEIVDFFRNFTVSVVGVGDVCSFAQMDVKKHGNPDWQGASVQSEGAAPDQYTQAEDGKVELSLVHFTTTNPNWVPPISAQQFVEEVQDQIKPHLQDSNVMFFASYQNFFDLSSMADITQYTGSMMNMGPGLVQGVPSFIDVKTSASRMEGPSDGYGLLSMTSSALALHDRYYMQSQMKRSLPAEETTPLLSPQSNL
ncbi:hypothetical protein NQ318_001354 [Aromia moschata]|uniref:Autophagy-related protein 9 n=1 Tax=Aromia moschata TaxID=1265417 RepID=A0AAV8YWY7_9CUCU|nr:hypothetical protein NQ318_001354 [Aromia moschata]